MLCIRCVLYLITSLNNLILTSSLSLWVIMHYAFWQTSRGPWSLMLWRRYAFASHKSVTITDNGSLEQSEYWKIYAVSRMMQCSGLSPGGNEGNVTIKLALQGSLFLNFLPSMKLVLPVHLGTSARVPLISLQSLNTRQIAKQGKGSFTTEHKGHAVVFWGNSLSWAEISGITKLLEQLKYHIPRRASLSLFSTCTSIWLSSVPDWPLVTEKDYVCACHFAEICPSKNIWVFASLSRIIWT